MIRTFLIVLAIFFQLLMNVSIAEASMWETNLILGFGVGFGGDTLTEFPVTVVGENYSYDSSSNLKAGGGGTINIGALFSRHNSMSSHYGVISTVGSSFNRTTDVEDVDSKFSSIPIEIVPYYQNNELRFSAGLTYIISPSFTDDILKNEYEFKNTLGYLIQVDLALGTLMWLGLRHASIDYSLDSINGNKVKSLSKLDGSYTGFTLSFNLTWSSEM